MPTEPTDPQDAAPAPGLGPSERAELERFRLLADSVPALIAYYERFGFTCLYANRAYAATFGLTPAQAVGRTYAQIVGGEAGQKIAGHVEVMLRERRTVSYGRSLVDADGRQRMVEVSLVPHALPAGDVVGAFVLISDVTHHHLIEAALRESEERMAKFMQASVEGIVFHREGTITDVNAPIEALLGLPAPQIVGRPILDFVAPAHQERVRQVMGQNIELTYEVEVVTAAGGTVPVESIGRNIVRGGESLRMVIVRDIRDRLAVQARIHHLAHHDALTGLPNRMAFMSRLEQAVAERGRAGGTLALLFVDLDHFKRVNDSLGHLAGDELLRAVATRLTESVRGSDTVGRFGGDEFMVLLSDVADRRDAEGVARKLLQVVQAPVRLGPQVVSVTPSIGIAFHPRDGAAPEDLVKHADTAMYVAKSEGRAGYRFFEPAMASRAYAAIVLEAELALALREAQFELALLPRVRLADGAPGGVLAQLRWRHPRRGLLAPEGFADVAAERRLAPAIVTWALHEAARLAARWRDEGLAVPALTLDLDWLRSNLVELVAITRRAWADAETRDAARGVLVLRVSESMLAAPPHEARRQLALLDELALPLELADFALGAAALGHLRARPVGRLGLGSAFVGALPNDAAASAGARALIAVARSLGLAVTAEGVENAAQATWLAQEGCALAQGPFIGAAMTPPEFARWWRAQLLPGGPEAAATSAS